MKITDYINTHEWWDEELMSAPYFLSIEYKDQYCLLHHTKNSDMTNPICREANCLVIKENGYTNKWEPVCFPFPKIYKYGENGAPSLDWPSAKVFQKIDGMLICVWNDQGQWHISTPSCIDFSNDTTFLAAIHNDLNTLLEYCKPTYTYIFNLTARKYNHLIDYGSTPQLWYISKRNMVSWQEENEIPKFPDYIPHARFFKYINKLEYMLGLQKILESNECGFVLIDKYGQRLQFEGFYYAHLELLYNEPLTPTRIIQLWQNDTLDEYRDMIVEDGTIDTILEKIEAFARELPAKWELRKNDFSANINNAVYNYVFSFTPVTKAWCQLQANGTEIEPLTFLRKVNAADIAKELKL